MSQDGKTKRVVVIGAGASGIGAARTLSAGGAEVIVLEGRDRIGGRMKKHCLTKNLVGSPRAGAEHYVNIQLGANWIHGMESTNPMFEVAQKLGLELYQTSSDDDPGDDVILFDSGARKASAQLSSDKATEVAYGRVSKEDYYESLSRYEWIKEYVDHISVNYDKEDISLQAAFDLALKASESEIFGPCPEPQKRVLTWLYDRVSIDLGAPSSKVSLNCYEEGVSDGAGGEGLVKHVGYSYVLHHLANEFPLDIRLNHAVSKISVCSMRADRVFELPGIAAPAEEQLSSLSDQLSACTLKDGRFVHIECANGESFAADACVITVPVGALQAESIHFSPRPPSVISSVCTSLKLGLMNLVWLWYPHVFWPEECNFLGIARDGSADPHEGEEVKFTTFLIPPIYDNNGERQPVLMCQIVGPYATTIETMSDKDIAAEATATLRAMFGADHVPDAVGCAHSTWGSDPFARGSWSYFPYRADSSSFGPGQDGAETETVERGVSCPDGAIVDAVRESQPPQPANIGCGGGAQMASAVAVSTTATTSSTTTATSPVGGARAQVSFVSDVRSNDAHAAVSISQAASSVLHGSASAAVPSAVRKYSDFGCTSDGTDSSSSDSDTDGYEALSTAFDSAGHTTTSTSSSSDEPSSSCGGGRHHAARTEDEVVSAHLYYASEAMSVLNRGTVHGAYLSGIREANKILGFLDDKTKL